MTYKSLKELFIAICDAIRYKDGSTEEINHQDIPARIRTLITSATSIFQRNKKVQPSETEQTVYPDDGYDGLSSVTVEAIPSTYIGSAVTKKEAFEYIPGTSDITIDENQYLIGAQTIKGDTDLISENIKSGITIFNVEGSYVGSGSGGNVDINLEEKDPITPTKSTQIITPSNGYDGLSKVTVNPIPNNYVDTSNGDATASHILSGKKAWVDGEEVTGNIPTKTSSNLSVSGATVTVPAGYYESQVSKSVSTVTQASPTITIDSNGLITASVTQGAGYVSSGTKSDTEQLTTQAAKTITPGTSSKTAVAKGVYTTGAVTVSGDSDLIASNIKKDVTIFNVTGTYTGSAPSLQSLQAVTPTESTQTLSVSSGYDGFASPVTINPIPSKYVDTSGMHMVESGSIAYSNYGVVSDPIEESGNVVITHTFDNDCLFRDGSGIEIRVPLSSFGDADKSQVLSGATFTSSKGLMQTGNAIMSSGDYSAGDIVKSALNGTQTFSFLTNYATISVRYCSNKSDLSKSNGNVSISNYSTVQVSAASDCNVLKGKYIQAEIYTAGTYGKVYYVPATGASFSITTLGGTNALRVSSLNEMFVIA